MKIAILASGGDAPGMNYVTYECFMLAKKYGIELLGVKAGFKGLMNGEFIVLDEKVLEENKNFGGAIIKSSRCPEFHTEKAVKKATKHVAKMKIECLIIMGGDGSLKGAKELIKHGVKVIFIPSTIDNDMDKTDYTLGFSSAVEACEEYVKLTQRTLTSLTRSGIYEVMGNKSGNIAEEVFKNSDSDYVVSQTSPLDYKTLVKSIKKNKKETLSIILQEKTVNVIDFVKKLSSDTGRDFRFNIVGYLQRGWSPCKTEIKMAKAFSTLAIECARTHDFNNYIVIKNGKSIKSQLRETL